MLLRLLCVLLILVTASFASPGAMVWSHNTTFSGGVLSLKEYDGKYLAALSRMGEVAAFNLQTGESIISFTASSNFVLNAEVFMAYGNDRLCVVTKMFATEQQPNGIVCADLSRGSHLFSASLPAPGIPKAVDLSVAGRVVVEFESLTLEEGLVLGNDGSAKLRVNGSIAVGNGVVYAARTQGNALAVSAYDLGSLRMQWQASTQVGDSPQRPTVGCVWNGGFVVSWGKAHAYRQLSAFSTQGGRNVWHRQFDSDVKSSDFGSCTGNMLFLGMHEMNTVLAIDLASGSTSYSLMTTSAKPIVAAPALGLALVPTNSQFKQMTFFGMPTLAAHDLVKGTTRWSVGVPTTFVNSNDPVVPAVSVVGANLIVVPNRLGFNFFDLPSGERVASGPVAEMRFGALSGVSVGSAALKEGSSQSLLLFVASTAKSAATITVTEVSHQ